MTPQPQSLPGAIEKRFPDNEEDDIISADYGTDSRDATSVKITQKQNPKKNSKNKVKDVSKSTAYGGRRTNNKNNEIVSVNICFCIVETFKKIMKRPVSLYSRVTLYPIHYSPGVCNLFNHAGHIFINITLWAIWKKCTFTYLYNIYNFIYSIKNNNICI